MSKEYDSLKFQFVLSNDLSLNKSIFGLIEFVLEYIMYNVTI